MILNIIFFLIAIGVLVYSGSWVVRSLTKFSVSLKISFFVISFILMAFATSIPELFIGISAAMRNEPIISLGNVLGSNIVNLSLILGISVLLVKKIKIKTKAIRNDFWHAAVIGLLPFALIVDGILSKIDGLILLAVFAIYLYFLFQEKRIFHKIAEVEENHFLKGCALNLVIFLVAVIGLIVSANYVVVYGTMVALDLQIPIILVSLFLIALGTSLPELVFSVMTVAEKREMTLGNLLGSTVMNASLVLGLTAVISPIIISDFTFLIKGVIALVLIFITLLIAVNTKKALGQVTAILLLVIYLAFAIFEFWNF